MPCVLIEHSHTTHKYWKDQNIPIRFSFQPHWRQPPLHVNDIATMTLNLNVTRDEEDFIISVVLREESKWIFGHVLYRLRLHCHALFHLERLVISSLVLFSSSPSKTLSLSASSCPNSSLSTVRPWRWL